MTSSARPGSAAIPGFRRMSASRSHDSTIASSGRRGISAAGT
ncbi:MAG: hypothetical protein WC993_08940 [Methanoculleus sp.]